MPGADLPTLGRSFARLKGRWARQGVRVRQLAAEADKIAKARGIGHLRGFRRQTAALEVIRDQVGYRGAWARWSATADELGGLIAMILSHPARTVHDLSVKFDGLAWSLVADSAVLDHEAERQVRAFARDLRRMAAAESQKRTYSGVCRWCVQKLTQAADSADY